MKSLKNIINHFIYILYFKNKDYEKLKLISV